ncbi:hypothetical protein C1H46_040872 [Malus baccata]|uniref:Uncharacterized protein n=1 Tax=Malus baccata TaxID=106549 RepID=A0A540KHA1_MALBA|nr:hypothetical protein C1H46_040872 [Malus baccata]
MSPTPTPLIYRKVRILFIDAAGATDGILATNALAHLEFSLHRKSGDPNAAFFDVVSRLGVGGNLAALFFTRGLKDGHGRGHEAEGSIRDMGMLQASGPHDPTSSDVGDEIMVKSLLDLPKEIKKQNKDVIGGIWRVMAVVELYHGGGE